MEFFDLLYNYYKEGLLKDSDKKEEMLNQFKYLKDEYKKYVQNRFDKGLKGIPQDIKSEMLTAGLTTLDSQFEKYEDIE